ncbi:MAG: sel1 repeat family protein [Thiotrichales bacterium]|nr:MAG: sel1 repeat family protein [Thiotrichales bacterium]
MKTHRLCYLSSVAAAILALLACGNAYAETAEEYVSKAEKAFDESDIVSAMSYYRKAAEAGYVPAQIRLAYLLDKSEENEEAVRWYQMAADTGDAEAEHGLAEMYAGGDGVAQDGSEAMRLFTSSASKGYTPAIRVMATAYEKGEMGVRVDYETAREWLEKGVQLNDRWSITRLAQAYARGELGLRIDRQRAAQLEQQLAKQEP